MEIKILSKFLECWNMVEHWKCGIY